MGKTRDIAPRRRLTAPELHQHEKSVHSVPLDAMQHHLEVVRKAERQWGEGMNGARYASQYNDQFLATYGEKEYNVDGEMQAFEWVAVTAYGSNCMCGYFIAWSPRSVHVMHDDPSTCEAMYHAAQAAQR